MITSKMERQIRRIAREEAAHLKHVERKVGYITEIGGEDGAVTAHIPGEGDVPLTLKDVNLTLAAGDKVRVEFQGDSHIVRGRLHDVTEPAEDVPTHTHPPHTHGTPIPRYWRTTTNANIGNNVDPPAMVNMNSGADENGYTLFNNGGVDILRSGAYLIGFTVPWDANGVGFRFGEMRADGVTIFNETCGNAGSALATVQAASFGVNLTAGELVTLHVRQNSGAALNVVSSDGAAGYRGRLVARMWFAPMFL